MKIIFINAIFISVRCISLFPISLHIGGKVTINNRKIFRNFSLS